jgi:hypothetical protein
LCGRLNLSKLRVPWYIDTRWNSTYGMLHRVLPYKHAISEILRNSPERLPLLCSIEEWDQLEQLHIFFRSFLQRNRPTIMLVHQLLQHLYLISKVCFFLSCIFLLQILNYFITNLFYFFQGVP